MTRFGSVLSSSAASLRRISAATMLLVATHAAFARKNSPTPTAAHPRIETTDWRNILSTTIYFEHEYITNKTQHADGQPLVGAAFVAEYNVRGARTTATAHAEYFLDNYYNQDKFVLSPMAIFVNTEHKTDIGTFGVKLGLFQMGSDMGFGPFISGISFGSYFFYAFENSGNYTLPQAAMLTWQHNGTTISAGYANTNGVGAPFAFKNQKPAAVLMGVQEMFDRKLKVKAVCSINRDIRASIYVTANPVPNLKLQAAALNLGREQPGFVALQQYMFDHVSLTLCEVYKTHGIHGAWANLGVRNGPYVNIGAIKDNPRQPSAGPSLWIGAGYVLRIKGGR